MRVLIVCCDGTWNTPQQPAVTNVERLYNAIADTDRDGHVQLSFYGPGVGTSGNVLGRITAGALGTDLDRKITDAYRWVTTTYERSDEIALFGFSRGAYTARSLAGMIKHCGLIDTTGLDAPIIDAAIQGAYTGGYRCRDDTSWRNGLRFTYDAETAVGTPVRFIGVWDTVGALGIPNNLSWLEPDNAAGRYAFHDVTLDPRIPCARHALALDEPRGPFQPTLWSNPAPDQDLQQVWFPGSHMDVGGGHLEHGLSDGALAWMIDEGSQIAGLGFLPGTRAQVHPDPLDVLHNDNNNQLAPAVSLVLDAPLAAATELLWDPRPRPAPLLDPQHRRDDVHPSVYERQTDPPVAGGRYRPSRLPTPETVEEVDVCADQAWNDTGLYLPAGDYVLCATGQWCGRGQWSGPDGTVDGPSDLAATALRLCGGALKLSVTMIRQAQRARCRTSPTPNWTFPGERRHPELPWMSLVAAVVDSAGATDNSTPSTTTRGHPAGTGEVAVLTHQYLGVGNGRQPLHVTVGGYLYTYANTAWNLYGNNTGKLRLHIQ